MKTDLCEILIILVCALCTSWVHAMALKAVARLSRDLGESNGSLIMMDNKREARQALKIRQ